MQRVGAEVVVLRRLEYQSMVGSQTGKLGDLEKLSEASGLLTYGLFFFLTISLLKELEETGNNHYYKKYGYQWAKELKDSGAPSKENQRETPTWSWLLKVFDPLFSLARRAHIVASSFIEEEARMSFFWLSVEGLTALESH